MQTVGENERQQPAEDGKGGGEGTVGEKKKQEVAEDCVCEIERQRSGVHGGLFLFQRDTG